MEIYYMKEHSLVKEKQENWTKQKLHICIHTQNSRQIQRTTI